MLSTIYLAMMGCGLTRTFRLTDVTADHTVADPNNSHAYIVIRTDGTVDLEGPADANYVQQYASTNWGVPNGDITAADYDVRYTNHAGYAITASGLAEDEWGAISSDHFFGLQLLAVGGPRQATFDIEIRDGTSQAVVASASYDLTIEITA